MAEHRYFVSFLTWLGGQQHRADPVGDLARDSAHDPDAEAWSSPSAFVQYVGNIGSIEAHEAAIIAAAEYLTWDQALER
jgi:hypothetical protein